MPLRDHIREPGSRAQTRESYHSCFAVAVGADLNGGIGVAIIHPIDPRRFSRHKILMELLD